MAAKSDGLCDLLDELESHVDAEADVQVNMVVEELGHRGFGPLIAVPALVAASPLGGIPGLPSLMSLIIAIFAVQILFHRKHLWLPDFLGKREISDGKLSEAIDKLRGVAGWIDRYFGRRMVWATRPPMPRVIAGVILIFCLVVPFVELLPFAAILPLAAIASLGLALTLRDGLLLIVSLASAILIALGLAIWRF